ncbi:MAG: alpha/beta fold hydrolase [Bacteroidales bacterium]|nr:alpha/beta fold hydrolase [Bacteroidales bacterium]
MIGKITPKITTTGIENTCIFYSKLFIVLFFILSAGNLITPVSLVAQQHISHSNLLEYYSENEKLETVLNPDDWYKRREQILAGMQLAMGNLPDRHNLVDLDVKIVSETKGEGYIRQIITFTSEPGDRIPALLYIPADVKDKKIPAMLALHPTGSLGKLIVAGEGPLDNRQYGLELAQRGYVVLCPDYPSFGNYEYDFEKDQYVSGTMKGIFNHMRCVDLLESLEYVDPGKIGVIGHSLGGHNAMFVGVFDQRLKVIVSSCGWTPFHDYYEGKIKGWTSPRYMPRLKDIYQLDPDLVPFDFYEVVAALAPRPFFSNSPLNDSNFSVEGVKKGISESMKIYSLLESKEKLQVQYPDCQHDFPKEIRQEAYDFIDAALYTETK